MLLCLLCILQTSMSVRWALTTVMPMLLVLTLMEASLVPATQAMREMESLAQVRPVSPLDIFHCSLPCNLDINECALGTDNCNANAACADTEGSFTCTCREGYTGDGVTCQSTVLS